MSRYAPWLLVILLTCLLVWTGIRWLEAADNLMECVVHEGLAHHERDFLVKLPALLRALPDRRQLVESFRKSDPDTAVREVPAGICWGLLFLKFEQSQLVEVREGCD